MDLIALRTALLITLTILLVVVAYRRFRQYVLRKHVPVPLHAELLALEVMYHPGRLRVVVDMPQQERLQAQVLDTRHETVHKWDQRSLEKGRHVLELELPALVDGQYHFDLRTTTQRTLRGFQLQHG